MIMKRFIIASCAALVLLVCVAVFASIGAHAVHAATSVTTTTSAAPPAASAGNPPVNPPAAGGDIPTQFSTIMIWIMSLFAWLVGVAALTLDWATYYTVVTMGNYVSQIAAIGLTWRIMRDLGNIILIFGFLAAGIMIILNTSMYGSGKKMLPTLLVAAVFLNFSLFMAEAVIDVGNIFATQFYTQINGGTLPNLSTLNFSNEGISSKIMSQLGLQTSYGQFNTNTGVPKGANSWIIGFMGIILFLITAFVMFSLALILITRFIILILLIMAAPIGFAGLAVPKLNSVAKQWWSMLFNQTITAPVLFLLLYMALAVITDHQFLGGVCSGTCSENWLGFVSNNGVTNYVGFASIMLSFLIAMGLLLLVVIVSKRMSAFGGSVVTKWAGAATFGATAFALRSTAGAGSRYASKKVLTSSFGGTKTGRLLATTFDRGARASFDVRASKAWGAIPYGGVNAGAVAKGGYEARRAGKIKAHEAYAKSIGEANQEQGPTEADAAKLEEEKGKASEIHGNARNQYGAAQKQHEANQKQSLEQHAEIDRLTAINTSNRNRGIFDQQNTNDLKVAKQKLGTIEANLATTRDNLKQKSEALGEAGKKLSTAEGKTAEDIMKDRVTKQKQQYAENITGFGGWALFGPGRSAAARKIKQSAKEKSPGDKLYEELKKKVGEEGKKSGEGGEEERSVEAAAEKPREETA